MKRYASAAFPDFRNFGVVLRTLVIAEVLRWIGFLVAVFPVHDFWLVFGERDALFEPVLLTVVACLAVAAPFVRTWRYGVACVFALVLAVAVAGCWALAMQMLLPFVKAPLVAQNMLVAAVVAAAVLFYFNWRHYRLSPAWSEARLMALQARIQPHFLFNSLNSVLSLIRVDPPKAENMLEDLCDLYRSLLSDSRQRVPLGQELELARTYLQIEGIRFGPRLRVEWVCQGVPEQALVPPLLLQPLLENAVRHGVEPQEGGALVSVEVTGKGGQLDIRVRNSIPGVSGRSTAVLPGNHMALDNLRERLELHYDAEASLTTDCSDGNFEVRVRLPIH